MIQPDGDITKAIRFHVDGKPATAGSKTGFVKNGRVVMVPANKRQKPWMQCIAAAAREKYPDKPMICPISLCCTFLFLRPKNHYGSGRNANVVKNSAPKHHVTRPDVSKLVRCVEDALTGIIWKDDSQVMLIRGIKQYTEFREGVKIDIYPIYFTNHRF